MAAGDAAMMQLAQTFSTLAQNTVKASNSMLSLVNAPQAAFKKLTSTFSAINAVATKFVSALNPAIVNQLELAFDDLFAVVGRAFTPILAASVPIVRAFADSMLPVMNALMPTFGALGDAMINIAIPVITAFSGVLFTLSPLLKLLGEMIGRISEKFGNALIPVVNELIPVFIKIYESMLSLEPAFVKLLDSVVQMALSLLPPIVDGLVPMITFLADSFGGLVSIVADAVKALTDFSKATIGAAKSLIDNVTDWVIETFVGDLKQLGFNQPGQPSAKKPGLELPKFEAEASRGAAAKGAQFTGFAEFGQQLMQASFGSSVNTPEFKTAENTAKIAEGIDKLVAQGQQPAQQFAVNQLARGVR